MHCHCSHNNILRKKQAMAKRTAVLYQAHANCMAQNLTGRWHCCRGLLCDLREASHSNTKEAHNCLPRCPDLIMWFAGRDQHMQLHHRGCCSRSRKAKSSFSAWFLLPDHLIRSLTPPCSRTTWATKRLSTANMCTMSIRAAPASSRHHALATTTWQSLPLTTCRQ